MTYLVSISSLICLFNGDRGDYLIISLVSLDKGDNLVMFPFICLLNLMIPLLN